MTCLSLGYLDFGELNYNVGSRKPQYGITNYGNTEKPNYRNCSLATSYSILIAITGK